MTNDPHPQKVEVFRKGTWPILKYVFSGEHGRYAEVYMDDDHGGIVISCDQKAFKHWWGGDGRATKNLRQFLVRTSDGYLKDKFSYGLERWNPDMAEENFRKDLIEKYGAEPDDPKEPNSQEVPFEIHELWESIRGSSRLSQDAFMGMLYGCSEIQQLYPDYEDYPNGDPGANVDVIHFIDLYWPHLVAFWKKELAEEDAASLVNSPNV